MEHFQGYILTGLLIMWSNFFVKKISVATSKWIETNTLFNIMIKERREIHPVKLQSINKIEWMEIMKKNL